jgi:RimJ/RimL family protein N-acetyltransferase
MVESVTLTGEHVRLVPLAAEHAEGLCAAVRDGELWRLWYTNAPSPEAMEAEIARRLALQAAGTMLPFTVMDAAGVPVGMTAYLNVDAANKRVEIGSTWYAKRAQRTALNTAAKLLLLTYAFEALGCVCVELRTHFMNSASRRAIERLGAKLDGVLRNNMIAANGTLRDTCVYSVIASEWPTVKAHLEWQMVRPR